MGLAVPSAVILPGSEVTIYFSIGLPPSSEGASKLTSAFWLNAVVNLKDFLNKKSLPWQNDLFHPCKEKARNEYDSQMLPYS